MSQMSVTTLVPDLLSNSIWRSSTQRPRLLLVKRLVWFVSLLLAPAVLLPTMQGGQRKPTSHRKWTLIKPAEQHFEFKSTDAAKVDFPIFAADSGKQLYIVKCRTPDSGGDETATNKGDWQGEWQCELWVAGVVYGGNLLQPSKYSNEAPWHFRNTFYAPALTGHCANDPEWGRERHYRLLGMDLTLRVENPTVYDRYEGPQQTARPYLKSWSFFVTARPDPSAISEDPAPERNPEPCNFRKRVH